MLGRQQGGLAMLEGIAELGGWDGMGWEGAMCHSWIGT